MARKRTEVGDFCVKGHKIEGDNVKWYRRDGVMYLRCKICQQAKSDKYEATRRKPTRPKMPVAQSHSERYDFILKYEVDSGSGKYTGLNYLKLNKRSQRAWEPLAEAFDRTASNCYENPGPYIDYDEDDVPFASTAYKLCEGCDMLVECARFAAAYKPVIGVWGGEVYIDGKVVR